MFSKKIFAVTAITLSSLFWSTPTPTLAAIGGLDGGGGNIDHDEPVKPHMVLSAIDTAKRRLPNFFAALETKAVALNLKIERRLMTEQDPEIETFLKASRKLFPASGRDIFSVLRSVHWDIREKDPCIDPYGLPSDGSATLPNTVCLSVSRLSQKLTQVDVDRKVLALIAHEVSHLAGTDDRTDEPKLIQDLANRASLYSDAFLNLHGYSQILRNTSEAMRRIRTVIDQGGSFDRICQEFQEWTPSFLSHFEYPNAGNFEGFAPARAEAWLKLNALASPVVIFLSYPFCSPHYNEQYKYFFGGHKERKLAEVLREFARDSIDQTVPMVSDEEMLGYVDFGDRDALVREFERLEQRMKRLEEIPTFRAS